MSDMKLIGTVSVINRLAQSVGFGAKSKVGPPCKGVLTVRNRGDGRQTLVISTRKDVNAHEFNVRKIQNLRTRHADDGIATIDVSEPPMSVLLKLCDPAELKRFLNSLKSFCKTATINGDPSAVPSKSKVEPNAKAESSTLTSRPEKEEGEDEKEVKSGSLRKNTGSLKRPRSPELSVAYQENVKKALLSTNFKLSVRKRENYPKEFAHSLVQIIVQGIGLRKFDNRMLKLKCLTMLDLAENQLKSVNQLVTLNSQLKTLSLASNQIESLPDDFFRYSPFSGLKILNLSNNQLTKLPSSINNLRRLANAKFNGNQLTYLPYNIMDMRSLRSLDVSENRLKFVPKTITLLELTYLDLSGNPTVTDPRHRLDIVDCPFPEIPTLFETTCELVMNMPLIRSISQSPLPSQDVPLYPSIVESYVNAGKYCMNCCKLSLRYKMTSVVEPTRSICVGMMSRCMISPVSECTVKTILCHNCDMRAKRRRRRSVGIVNRIMVNF